MVADDLLTWEGLGEGGELRGLVVPGCALKQQAVALQQREALAELGLLERPLDQHGVARRGDLARRVVEAVPDM